MPKKRPAQLELFAARDKNPQTCPGKGSFAEMEEIHALGLLGWKDPLWTTRFEIELLDGSKLPLTLATIRQLHAISRAPDPEPPILPSSLSDGASTAESKPSTS